jgi:hypothetical protein
MATWEIVTDAMINYEQFAGVIAKVHSHKERGYSYHLADGDVLKTKGPDCEWTTHPPGSEHMDYHCNCPGYFHHGSCYHTNLLRGITRCVQKGCDGVAVMHRNSDGVTHHYRCKACDGVVQEAFVATNRGERG